MPRYARRAGAAPSLPFADYFGRLGLPNVMPKKSFHVLARHVPRDEIDAEIGEKLDIVARVAGEAEGRG